MECIEFYHEYNYLNLINDKERPQWIKETFQELCGEYNFQWKAITTSSTNEPKREEKNYKTSSLLNLDQIKEKVQSQLELWLNSRLHLNNINHFRASLLSQKDFRNQVEFCDAQQASDYETFLEKLENFLFQFSSGIYNKVNDHVCFLGTEKAAFLDRILNREVEGAEEDLEFLDKDDNIFNPLVKKFCASAIRKIRILYQEDNEKIIGHEGELSDDVITKTVAAFSNIIHVKMESAYPVKKLQEVTTRLVEDYQKAIKNTLETPIQINDIFCKTLENLKLTLENNLSQVLALKSVETAIFYITHNFDVALGVISNSEKALSFVENEGNEMLIPGQVAFYEAHNKFYFGREADICSNCSNNFDILFSSLFELVCDNQMDAKWRRSALQNFFRHLRKFYLPRETIIVLPDWISVESIEYLKETLENIVFPTVLFSTETDAIAAGYLKEKIWLTEGTGNRALKIFKVVDGYIHVGIYFHEKKSNGQVQIKGIHSSDKIQKIHESLYEWYMRRKEKGQLSQSEWSLAIRLNNHVSRQFEKRCFELNRPPSMDVLIVANNRDWEHNLKRYCREDGNTFLGRLGNFERYLRGASLSTSEDISRSGCMWLPQNQIKQFQDVVSENSVKLALHKRRRELEINCNYLLKYCFPHYANFIRGTKGANLANIEYAKYTACNCIDEEDITGLENIIAFIMKKKFPFLKIN